MSGDKSTDQRPSPGEFDDYRAYLEALIEHLRNTRRFSYRYFAQRAGFSSTSFLKLVLQGERNLSPSSIGKFVKALSLSAQEADAFEALVLFNQAKTDEERNRHYIRLRKCAKSSVPMTQLDTPQYDLYSRWYVLPIREMLLLPDFQEDPVWISKRIFPPIKPEQAAKSLELLEKIGLARRNKEGRLVPVDVKLATPKQVASLAVRNFQRAMLQRSEESLESVAIDERNFTSLTAGLTAEQYKILCEEIREFEKRMLDLIEDSPRSEGVREIYHMAVQLFPVTRGKKKEGG